MWIYSWPGPKQLAWIDHLETVLSGFPNVTIESHNESYAGMTPGRCGGLFPTQGWISTIEGQVTGIPTQTQCDDATAFGDIYNIHLGMQGFSTTLSGCASRSSGRPCVRDELFYTSQTTWQDLLPYWHGLYQGSGSQGIYMQFYDFGAYRNAGCPDPETGACADQLGYIDAGGAFIFNLNRLGVRMTDIVDYTGTAVLNPPGTAGIYFPSGSAGNTHQLHFLTGVVASGNVLTPLLPSEIYVREYRKSRTIGLEPGASPDYPIRTFMSQATQPENVPFLDAATSDDGLVLLIYQDPEAPFITGVSPSPTCGQSVTITGQGFAVPFFVNQVLFGGVPAASFVVNSDATITATPAQASGTVTVTVFKPYPPSGGDIVADFPGLVIAPAAPTPAFCIDPDGGGPRPPQCSNPPTTLPAVGPVGNSFSFTTASCGPGCTYSWDFGDTFTSNAQTPTHAYTAQGNYDVSLMVTTSAGCSATTTVPKAVVVGSANPPVLIVGDGAGPSNVPRVFGAFSGGNLYQPANIDFKPYAAPAYGVNVGVGDIGQPIGGPPPRYGASILTGPGPGAVFGPQVRGWNWQSGGTSISKINYFAYGTLRYGVNVAAGDIDGDIDPDGTGPRVPSKEILTGPGPGTVFGPHVRGWNYDGVGISALSKVSFFAYGTLKYGVNVNAGTVNIDSGPGGKDYEEILTGPGPGAVFSSNVRAFNYDNSSITSTKVNFIAYSGSPALSYGVKVAGADLDGDGDDDLVTARGAGPNSSTDLHSYELVNGVPTFVPPGASLPGAATLYGANVAGGDINSPGPDYVFAARGPDPNPAATSDIAAFKDLALNAAITGNTYVPYGPPLGYVYGATVAGVDDPGFNPFAARVILDPGDDRLRRTRDFVKGMPDSAFKCKCCDQPNQIPPGEWNVWGADTQKNLVVDKFKYLLANLPDLSFAGVVQALDDAAALASAPEGIIESSLLAEFLAQVADIRGLYDPQTFPSTAVTGRLADGFLTPDNLAFSEPTATVFVRPGPFPASPGFVQAFDADRLFRLDDRTLPSGNGTAKLLGSASGRPDVYVVSLDPTGEIAKLERLSRPGILIPDAGVMTILDGTSQSSFLLPRVIVVTPPAGATGLRPDTAYVSIDTTAPEGRLFAIQGIRNFNQATVAEIDTHAGRPEKPFYRALALSPATNSDVVYALHNGGVDAIATLTNQVTANAFSFPSGFTFPVAMTAGVTSQGDKRIFVVSPDRLLVYKPSTSTPIDDLALPGDVIAVHLSIEGKFLLITRFSHAIPQQSLLVLNANSHNTLRDSLIGTCPPLSPCNFAEGASPMALSIDGAHAIAANPNLNELDYVYLTKERVSVASGCLVRASQGIPVEAFATPPDKQHLINRAKNVQQFLALAEAAPDNQTEQSNLQSAQTELEQFIKKVDGCFGGNPGNDLVIDCAAQEDLLQVANGLMPLITTQIKEVGCPGMFP